MSIRLNLRADAVTGLPPNININARIAELPNLRADWLFGNTNPARVTTSAGKIASVANMLDGGADLLAVDATDRALYDVDELINAPCADMNAATTLDPQTYKWDSAAGLQPVLGSAHSRVVFFRVPDDGLPDGSYTLMGSYNSNASRSYMYLDGTADGLRAVHGDGIAVSGAGWFADRWHCGIMCWNGTNAVRVSLDFSAFVTTAVATPGSPSAQVCVGARTTAGSLPFIGKIKRAMHFAEDISTRTGDAEALAVLQEYFEHGLGGLVQ